MMGVTQVSTEQSWEADVINAPLPVFVDFWAEWCGPCRLVSPIIDELATDYEGRMIFVKVNVDQANNLASKYKIYSIPTLLVFNKGEVVDTQIGAASKEAYKKMIEKTLAE